MTIRYIRRPGLGLFVPKPAVDPTAGLPGGAPISFAGTCSFRVTADGQLQTNGTSNPLGGVNNPCKLNAGGAWSNVPWTSAPVGMPRVVDGIAMVKGGPNSTVGFGGIGDGKGNRFGWYLTDAGQQELNTRIAAMRAAGQSDPAAFYAPLPPGIDQTTIVNQYTQDISDPVSLNYVIAKGAAAGTHGPSQTYRIYDPFTWKGYQALPDGFLEPQDGGVWVLASDNVLDGAQKLFGIMTDPWYWLVATHPTTGQQRLFLAKRDPGTSNLFTRLGKTGPLVITVLGTVLAPFTAGASLAVAAVVNTTIAIEQKKAAAKAAERTASHQADVMNQQVADQEAQVQQQADTVYHDNQTAFLAAGYDQAAWDKLTLEQKTALLQQAAAGQLKPTPAAIASAAAVQNDVAQAVQSATVAHGLGVEPPGSGSSGTGTALALGAGFLAILAAAGGKKR